MQVPRLLNRRIVVTLVALALAFGLAGEVVGRMRARSAVQAARALAGERATLLSRALDDQFNALLTIIDLTRSGAGTRALMLDVEKHPDFAGTDQERRTRLAARPDVAGLSGLLQRSTARIGLIDAVYEMDPAGHIMASSDWKQDTTRLGRTHADRDFVARLRTDDLVQEYAPSLTTQQPGVVFGMPVLDGTRHIGSVAVRADAAAFSKLLDARKGALMLVTDSAGVVVASSDEAQVLHRIDWSQRTPSPADRAHPLAAGIHGSASPDSAADYRFHRAWMSAPIPRAGWTLHSIEAVTEADVDVRDTRALAALLWLIAALGIVFRARSVAQRAAIIAAKDAAERAEAAKSVFLATMSHEIRTPMSGVMSMAEMLENTELDEDQRSMLSVVRTSADALLTVINDILDFSKIEAGKMELESVEFDPAKLVENAVQLLAGRAQQKSIALLSEIGPGVPATVRGDAGRIKQIILNLAGNALKFTEAGHACVRVQAAGENRLRFETTDTGIGLSAEERGRLFQPFVQADSSTARRFGGTGLGLSICRRLAELMGGAIGVDSVKGEGSTFWFELPLATVLPPPQPAVAIDDAQVMLAGFPPEEARILDGYVRAAGARAAIIVERASDAITRFSADPRAADVVVFPTYPKDIPGGALTTVRELRALPGCDGVAVAMVVPATLISSASAAAATGMVATTTAPVRKDRFWRTLGVALGRAQADTKHRSARSETNYQAPPREEAAKAGALILVAEDNKTIQVVIGRVLRRLGFAFDIVENGAIALRLLQSSRPQFGVLLTDFHMPEMDGFELTRRWREIEASGAVQGRLPILALTADALAGMAERCRAAGMDGYLTKPIDRAALLVELERFLPVAFTLRTESEAPAPRRGRAARAAQPAAAAAPAEPVAEEPPIDVAAFAEQIGVPNGPEAAALIKSLWESVSSLPDRLSTTLTARDRAALREAAHGGKGEAKAIGASPLGALCSELQDQAEAAAWPVLDALVQKVCLEHARVARAVVALGRA